MSNKQPGQIDIQPLPKRLYKQVYGDDYDEASWKLRKSKVSNEERQAFNALACKFKFKVAYKIPEVNIPQKRRTADLLVDGKLIEIKGITTEHSIQDQVSSAVGQIDSNGIILLDASKSKLNQEDIIAYTTKYCRFNDVPRFAITHGNNVIALKELRYKKDDLLPHPSIGHDVKSSYIDILPETSKKSTKKMTPVPHPLPGREMKPSYTNILPKTTDESTDLSISPDIIKNFKPRKQTNKYWQKRAEARLTESEKITKTYERQVHKVYEEAQRKTVQQLKDMYAAYYKGKEGFDIQALRSIAPTGDIKRFRDEMRKLGLSTYLPDNYKGRISRLELLNAQMWAEVKKAAIKQVDIESTAHRSVYENSYYKTAYDVSKGIGATPASFGVLDTQTVDDILSAKFQGKSFSERIWSNTDILAKQLKEKLAVAIATGQSIEKTSREFRERFGVQKYYADRLIRTESNYFHNSAAIESYFSMGIEMFEFLATLDMRTSDVCQSMDGKRFKVKDAMPGVNYPPLHPNCRSCVVPYVKGYEPQGRMYRDPETNRNKYISNISYKEWSRQFKDEIQKAKMQEKQKVQSGRLKTIARAVRKYGTSAVDGAVFYDKSLNTLDSKMVMESKKFIDDMLIRFPDIANWLRNKHGGLAITTRNSTTSKAATTRDGSLMLLSRNSYSNRKKYINDLIKEINHRSKMFVPADKHSIYTTAHEFGHVVEAYLTRNTKREDLMNKYGIIKSKLTDEAITISGKSEKEVRGLMSSYGQTKPQELFAESFASYILGGNSIWAKAMENYLEDKGLLKQ